MMHIPSMKVATKHKIIEEVPAPDLLLVPLPLRFGSKPLPLVQSGDKVKRFQLIARSEQGDPACVHSPVSGMVEKVAQHVQTDGSMAMTVFIRNDRKNAEDGAWRKTAKTDTPQELLSLISEAGIVGLGGAQFPSAKKYDRGGKKVDTFIINGAECEPYLTGDYALMAQRAGELLEGVLLIDRILDAKRIVIAIENSDRELEDVYRPLLALAEYAKISFRLVPDRYPQGGELQLARTVTGIEIPKGTLPLDKGVIVSNVGTVLAVRDAVNGSKPVVERVITVSGEQAGRPGNYRVMVGTPVWHLVDTLGIDPARTLLVSGGPMMSPMITDLSVPVTKGTLGLVALAKHGVERMNCIWCGYCADVCPMRLMPMKYDQFFRQGKYSRMADYDLMDCIECAACEYVCPSRVPLVRSIKEGKSKLKQLKDGTR